MARIPDERNLGRRPTPAPARGLPNFAPVARGMRRAATAITRDAGTAGQGFAHVAQFAEERLVEQQRTQYAEARSAWSSGLIELDEKYREDKEYDTLLDRYGADLDKLHGDIAGTLPGHLRQSFDQVTSPDRARARSNMQGVARDRSHDATRAHLVDSLDAYRRAYLTAEGAVGRSNALEAGNAAVNLALARGAIDEETAAVQRQTFAATTATDRVLMMPSYEQVTTLLSDNPLSLAMDPADRAKHLRAAIDDLDEGPSEAFKESSGRLANQMLIGINQGRLTERDIIAADQDLTVQDQRVLINALGDLATPQTDPFVFADLHARALDGEDVMAEARQEYLSRALSQEDYVRLTGMVLDRPGPGSIYDRTNDALSDRLRPGPFESRFDREGAEIRRSNAMREFDEWHQAHPNATESEYWEQVGQIGQRWSSGGTAEQRRATLPRPMFYQSIQTDDDLNSIHRRINDHFLAKHDGNMTVMVLDPDFIKQAEILQQWREFLATQEQ